jgi:hypothetical protein
LSGDRAELARLGITHILFHRALYVQAHRPGIAFAERALWDAGWHPTSTDGPVTLWAPGEGSHPPGVPPLPPPRRPILCSGWHGRTMTDSQATIWIYGSGSVSVRLGGGRPAVFVDGKRDPGPLEQGWHSLLLVTGSSGATLQSVAISP